MVNTIRAIGEIQGKTLEEIGKGAGVGAKSIYRWDTIPPKIITLKKVAKYLDVNYKLLLPE